VQTFKIIIIIIRLNLIQFMFTKLPESTARLPITETARNTGFNSVIKYSCKSAYQSRKSVTLIQLKTGTKYIKLLDSNTYIHIYIYIYIY